MKARLAIAVLLVTMMTGCAVIDVGQREPAPKPAAQTSADGGAVQDPRPIGDIRRENEQLRARQAKLEENYKSWQSAVSKEEARKKQLNQDKDRLKDELKDAKKRADRN